MKLSIALLLACCAAVAQAQSLCSSDDQPTPATLVERFVSADCETCWTEPHATPSVADASALALDWIVPSARADEAPLAGATRDALVRLEMLQAAAPRLDSLHQQDVSRVGAQQLRVAHGLPLVNYVGASIALTPARGGPWTAVLLLVQHIPAGTQGTPVARNLVRNMLVTSWNEAAGATKDSPSRFFESRPMSLPAGTRVEQLRAVGWVQDEHGRVAALAQSACQTPPPD